MAFSFGLKAFAVEAFKLPSAAMSPTLLIGDHVFVNKLKSPGPGDIAVFDKAAFSQLAAKAKASL